MVNVPRNIRPQRQLGQCFLMDERILEREIAYAQIAAEDTVLEVGAGIGNPYRTPGATCQACRCSRMR